MNIWAYVIRRLLYTIPVLLGVCLIIFILFNVVGGDPALLLLGKHATLDQLKELHHEMGLDRSWFLQYIDVVRSAFTFDFGYSWSTKQRIIDMIRVGAIPSITISFPAFFIGTILALVTAMFTAFYRGKAVDRIVLFFCIAAMSIPSLAYILFSQWFFAFQLGWFEISGYDPSFPEFVPYVILPILIWVALELGPDVRFYRTIILDEFYQDYVRTARSKGLSDRAIMFKHILKNCMVPIITYVIIVIPFLILGALLLERFFGIPGLGAITVNAIESSDFPVIKAMTILTSVAYVIFSVITDVLYMLVDPRIRLK